MITLRSRNSVFNLFIFNVTNRDTRDKCLFLFYCFRCCQGAPWRAWLQGGERLPPASQQPSAPPREHTRPERRAERRGRGLWGPRPLATLTLGGFLNSVTHERPPGALGAPCSALFEKSKGRAVSVACSDARRSLACPAKKKKEKKRRKPLSRVSAFLRQAEMTRCASSGPVSSLLSAHRTPLLLRVTVGPASG